MEVSELKKLRATRVPSRKKKELRKNAKKRLH